MLKVGKIVYLLDKKTHAVVPCKIIEKIQSITETGETVKHVVRLPSEKSLTLETYKSPWFETIEGARTSLLESATALIDSTLEITRQKEEKYFPSQKALDEAVSPDVQTSEEDSVYVELENGQKAKVSLPEGL